MAERRMFAKSVIGSARFLRMPATSRLLYYDLGMEADDDGCVEAFGVMRKTGANEDDLRVLASKGFVRVLNEDLVSYILDWNTNNQIRKDRYHKGIYKHLIGTSCEVVLSDGSCPTTTRQPSDNQTATEVSIGKDSIGKVSTESMADKPPTSPKPTKKSFGEYGWVKLTEDEYNRLVNDLGEDEAKRCITYVDESAQSTNNKNKWRDWNLLVRRCHRDKWGMKPNPKGTQISGADRILGMIERGEFDSPRYKHSSCDAMNDLQTLHEMYGEQEKCEGGDGN